MALLGGNSCKRQSKYMANIFGELQDDDASNMRPGPKSRIESNDQLWADRDHLLGLLETYWHEIGGKLPKVKTAADVLSATQFLEKYSQAYLVQTLLRQDSSPADGRLLHKLRRQIGEMNKSRLAAWNAVQRWQLDLEAATNLGNRELTEHERVLVEGAKAKRTAQLDHAKEELAAVSKKQKDAELRLQEGETYFARKEFANFCRSRRYTLNPLNTANALAGLPKLGWRRSIERCQERKPTSANGGSIQILNSIRRIVRTCTRKSEMVKHAEHSLRHAPIVKSEAYGVSELRKDWFYLQWAIRTALEAKVRTRDLPFAITQEYWKRKDTVSAVDRFLAEGESIVV